MVRILPVFISWKSQRLAPSLCTAQSMAWEGSHVLTTLCSRQTSSPSTRPWLICLLHSIHWNMENNCLLLSLLFSCQVVSHCLWPHGLQHTRLPCPSPTPGAYSSSCPSRWCHPTISSSVAPFSSCLQSFPASRSFPMSRLFSSGGHSIGASALASVLHWMFRVNFL